MSKIFDDDMREQQQDGWLDDYEYGFSNREPGLDPAFSSWAEANAQFFNL